VGAGSPSSRSPSSRSSGGGPTGGTEHPDPTDPMARTTLPETAPEQLTEWPSLDSDDHFTDDPAL